VYEQRSDTEEHECRPRSKGTTLFGHISGTFVRTPTPAVNVPAQAATMRTSPHVVQEEPHELSLPDRTDLRRHSDAMENEQDNEANSSAREERLKDQVAKSSESGEIPQTFEKREHEDGGADEESAMNKYRADGGRTTSGESVDHGSSTPRSPRSSRTGLHIRERLKAKIRRGANEISEVKTR